MFEGTEILKTIIWLASITYMCWITVKMNKCCLNQKRSTNFLLSLKIRHFRQVFLKNINGLAWFKILSMFLLMSSFQLPLPAKNTNSRCDTFLQCRPNNGEGYFSSLRLGFSICMLKLMLSCALDFMNAKWYFSPA